MKKGMTEMITCTFAGHKEVYQSGISDALDRAIAGILSQDEDSFCFLVGGMGQFDGMCAAAVRKAKRLFPDKSITLCLVLPYFKQELNESKEYYEQMYDDVYIPMELTGVHPKGAITKRNRLMVNQSDYLIAYVCREYGGAYSTLKYAQKRNLKIENLSKPAHATM